jgi:photosystem II stability/assembly factor-like uncharacterized protein
MISIRAGLLGALVASVSCACVAAQPNGGAWQMQDSGTTAGLRGIDSVDGTVAWASGTGGTVLRTTDGGAHWARCATPDAEKDGATLDFRGVQAWDAQTAIVMASGPGDRSRLYKTTDGCKTWRLIFQNPDSPSGFFDSFWMYPQYKEGIVLGDPVQGRIVVLQTHDGGVSWKSDADPGLAVTAMSIGGFAASNGLLAQTRTGYMYGFVVGGRSGSYYFSRTSSFDWWSKVPLPLTGKTDSAGPFAFGMRWTRPACTDCPHPVDYFFIAVGGDYTKPNDSTGTAAWSADGGQHWTASAKPPHGYRSSVQWSEPLKLWITVGTNGSDISRDDGKTWQPLDDGNWNALSLPFVAGPNGRIARLDPAAIPAGGPAR